MVQPDPERTCRKLAVDLALAYHTALQQHLYAPSFLCHLSSFNTKFVLFTFSTHVVLCVSGRVCVHGCTRCSDLQYVLVITAAKWFSCDLLTSSVRLISLNSFSVKKQKGIPYELQRLQQNGRDLRDTELPFAGFALGNTYHRAEPLTMLLRLCGGKGGFGSMLRAMGSQKSG